MPTAVPEDPEVRRRRREAVERIMYESTRREILEQVARGEIIFQEGVSTEPPPPRDPDAPIPGVLDLPVNNTTEGRRGNLPNEPRDA